MQTKANLQDLFLLQARRDRLPVTMFLMNGCTAVKGPPGRPSRGKKRPAGQAPAGRQEAVSI